MRELSVVRVWGAFERGSCCGRWRDVVLSIGLLRGAKKPNAIRIGLHLEWGLQLKNYSL